MSAWKKYLILFAVLFAFGAAITWFMGKTKIPPELEPASVQLHLANELEFMRQLVRDMPYEVPPIPERGANIEAISEIATAWDQLEKRADEFNHPAIRGVAMQIRQGDSNRVRMVLQGGHRFHRGWSMLKKTSHSRQSGG